jgi:hypothetical protein
MNGGDPDWIEGIHKIPKKIYNLLELNQLLAHQPWLVTKEHISVRSEIFFLFISFFLSLSLSLFQFLSIYFSWIHTF